MDNVQNDLSSAPLTALLAELLKRITADPKLFGNLLFPQGRPDARIPDFGATGAMRAPNSLPRQLRQGFHLVDRVAAILARSFRRDLKLPPKHPQDGAGGDSLGPLGPRGIFGFLYGCSVVPPRTYGHKAVRPIIIPLGLEIMPVTRSPPPH